MVLGGVGEHFYLGRGFEVKKNKLKNLKFGFIFSREQRVATG